MTSPYAFIAVEGGDAVGKTTVISVIEEYLHELKLNPKSVHGHALGEFGQNVRDVILNDATGQVSHTTQLLLFLANRRHIYENIVMPVLESGGVAVVDRWHLTSYAYQSEAENIDTLVNTVCPVLPTLSIVLVSSYEKAQERNMLRGDGLDHLAKRNFENHSLLNNIFTDTENLAKTSEDYVCINTNGTKEEVANEVRKVVAKHLVDKGMLKNNRVILSGIVKQVSEKLVKTVAIAAMDTTGGVGIDNGLPNFPRLDLLWFQHNTKSRVCIVGRKTLESMPPLTDRTFIVLTKDRDYRPKHEGMDITICTQLDEAISLAKHKAYLKGERHVYLIGGISIYEQAISYGYVDEAIFTEVQDDCNCNMFLDVRAMNEAMLTWTKTELFYVEATPDAAAMRVMHYVKT